MQVVSTPLIAVTVYRIFVPASPATSIILGFASGFASEPILLAIRALVEKLQPASLEYTDINVAVGSAAKEREGVANGLVSESNGVAKTGWSAARALLSEPYTRNPPRSGFMI